MDNPEWVKNVKAIRDALIALSDDKDFQQFVDSHLREHNKHAYIVAVDAEMIFRDLWARIELYGIDRKS